MMAGLFFEARDGRIGEAEFPFAGRGSAEGDEFAWCGGAGVSGAAAYRT